HELLGALTLLLIIGLLITALVSERPWPLGDVALLLFALYLGLTYVRFVFLLGILVAPILAKLLDFMPPYDPDIDKPVLNLIIMTIVVAITVRGFPLLSEVGLENRIA